MKTILIIDDQKDDMETMNQILKKAGYDVLTSSGFSEACTKLDNKKVDLILLDIMMPNLSGYDILKILREKQNRNIPVVFVSIKHEKEVDMTNADGFVQKPFDPDSLTNEVNKTIKKSSKSLWW